MYKIIMYFSRISILSDYIYAYIHTHTYIIHIVEFKEMTIPTNNSGS